MINFIHPYPAIQASSQLKQAMIQQCPTQMNFSVQEIDRQTMLYKIHPLWRMRSNLVGKDHNELVLKLLDKMI